MKSQLFSSLSLFVALVLAGAPIQVQAQTGIHADAAAAARPAKRTGIAQAAGLKIHYAVHGDLRSGRTPLLVLHGAYMSADAMAPFVERFAKMRPVVVIDQRGHGRTGDAPGPLTYEALADDARAVLDALQIRQVDVLGYSMGGCAGIQLAIRHPARVARLISISAGTRLDSWYPEVLQGVSQMTPAMFDNTPIRREYDRLAPRREDFAKLVQEIKDLDAAPYDWDAALRALRQPMMIVAGDYDVFKPEHAVELFRMRGGGDAKTVAGGFLTQPPPARLLILPATSHIGIMAAADVIVLMATPFLDDATPPLPPGFFQ